MLRFTHVLSLLGALWCANAAHAATFTVTNLADSGSGSLRGAILSANAVSGTDTIAFNIPEARGRVFAGVGRLFVIEPGSELPVITSPVVIDGSTQPGYQGLPVVVLSGAQPARGSGSFGGLMFRGGNSTVTGLMVAGFSGNGVTFEDAGGNTVERCIIGRRVGVGIAGNSNFGVSVFDSPNNRIGVARGGATNVIAGNGGAGVFLFGSTSAGNVVANNYIGTDLRGSAALPNNGGVLVGNEARGTQIGGTSPLSRNVISGNDSAGVMLTSSDGTRVQGNFIGVEANGREPLGNATGINVVYSDDNVIGGDNAGSGNVISGNAFEGISIALSVGNRIQGNFIGTDETGRRALGNGNLGVSIFIAADTLIGHQVGDPNGMGRNVIAHHRFGGIEVTGLYSLGNSIRVNSIYDNGDLGINLKSKVGDQVTFNDTGDGDDGPNSLQNFPLLASAMTSNSRTLVSGSLNSTPNSTFVLDFYASPQADASGYGEGRFFLDSMRVTTDAGGNVAFTSVTSRAASGVVTAIATNLATGDSSEFSLARAVTTGGAAPSGTTES